MFKKIKLNVQKLIGVYLCSVLLPVSLFGYSSRSEAFEQSFDLIWNTVNESHWDPSFAGLDWEQVRKDYRPRLRKVRDRGDLVQLLQAMLNELALSHFRILSNSVDPIDRFPRGGYSGLSLKYMDKQAYVVRVAPESPAEEAGIEVGWKLKSIHRKSVKRLIAPFLGSALEERRMNFHIELYLNELIQGGAARKIRTDWYPPEGRAVKKYLVPAYDFRELSDSVGMLPPQRIEYEETVLKDDIHYMRFNFFVPDLMEPIRETILAAADDGRGLVIDLRSNAGGLAIMASAITGLLVEEKTTLGKLVLRNGYITYQGYPQRKRYKGPVALLIDGGSVSTSEMLAAGLQESGRARVFGETSLGESLPSVAIRLPSGDLFQFAVGDYFTPRKFRIEKHGVVPDERVSPDPEQIRAGRDIPLERAVEWLREQMGKVNDAA